MNLVNRNDKHNHRNHPDRGAPPGRIVRAIICSVCLLTLCMIAPPALSADEVSPAPVSSRPVQSGNPAVNAVTQAAVQGGVLSCAGRINQVTNFLSAKGQSGAFLFLPFSQPDQRLFSASLEIQGQETPTVYASESFAPNQANGCGGMYETVEYWSASCDDLATRQFPALKSTGVLYRNIKMMDGGAGVRIFLMPAGAGCISIKKEVIQ